MTERKSADTRRGEIADAALRVIAEQGLGRFTALAVAREVGTSDAALFRHFGTMQDIVLAVIDRVEEILFAGIPPDDRDPVARLGKFFHQRVGVILAHPGVALLVSSDALAQAAPAEAVVRVQEFRRRSLRFVRSCLAEASRQRSLAAGVGIDEAQVIVIGAILALTQGHRRRARPSQVEALAARTWSVLERFLRGSRRQPAASAARP